MAGLAAKPGIEPAIEQVDDEVGDDHGSGNDKHCTTARSRLVTDTTRSLPMPGQEKMDSTTTAPAIREPTIKPTMVTIGTAAFGSAWVQTTSFHFNPLAEAVRMNGWLMTSIIAERENRARMPIPPILMVKVGRIPCCQVSCPPDGRRPSVIEKISTSNSPMTKDGIVKPRMAPKITPRSITL